MKHSKSLLACAALAGLYTGAAASSVYASVKSHEAGTKIVKVADNTSDKSSCKGVHNCKGQNDCKGQGGCKSATNSCKGQNDCKGKGGCSTAKKPSEDDKSKG
ncbi:MAG TPA: hypothetical protein VIM69_06675 [Opitutaceae bacterium]